MEKINLFLDTTVEGIVDTKKKRDVREELEDHVMEKFEEYKRRGFSDQEAEEKTVEEMGDSKDLSEKMSELHSFVPHVYYARSVIVLLVGLIFSHSRIDFYGYELVPQWIGIAFVFTALFLCYPLGTKSKIAFWIYTAVQITARVLALCKVEHDGVVLALGLPIAMTLLSLDFFKVDRGNKSLKWVISLEWIYVVLALIDQTKDFSILPFLLMVVGVIIESMQLGKFARRARDCEWEKKKGFPLSLPIVLAVLYAISLIVPMIVELRLNAYRPTAHEWTGTKQEVLIMNAEGERLDYIEYASYWVNQVQGYMDEEDYQKLASCETLQRISSYNLSHKARYTVVGEKDGRTYLVQFYYYSNSKFATNLKVDRSVCYQSVELRTSDYLVHTRNFYRGSAVGIWEYDVGQRENGGYFYTFKEWDTFGYLFAEWEGSRYDFVEYRMMTHEMDFFHPERVDFEDGWKEEYVVR